MIYIGAAFGLLFALAVLPAGYDYAFTFDQVARGCVSCAFYPYHFSWFLRPLGLFDDWKTAYLVLLAVTFILLFFSARTLKGSALIALVAAPSLWSWWLGQVDILPIAGIALGWYGTQHKRPYLVSLALVLLSTKPQAGGLIILLLLFWNRADFLKVISLPILAALLSFVQFGIDWPLRWLHYNAGTEIRLPAPHYAAHPILLALLPGVLLMKTRAQKLQYLVTLIPCAVPYVGAYSYSMLMVFPVRWYEFAIGYLGFVLMVIMGTPWGFTIIFVQALLILGRMLWENIQAGRREANHSLSYQS